MWVFYTLEMFDAFIYDGNMGEGGAKFEHFSKKIEGVRGLSVDSVSLLDEWCRANNHLRIVTLSEEEWRNIPIEERFKLAEKGDHKEINIPDKPNAVDVVRLIRAIDADTFEDKGVDWSVERSRKYDDLGEAFMERAVYLAQRMVDVDAPPIKGAAGDKDYEENLLARERRQKNIELAKEAATDLVNAYYSFGSQLRGADKPNEMTLREIASKMRLNYEQTEKLDKVLAGDDWYEELMGKALERGMTDDEVEALRRRKVLQYFLVTGSAFGDTDRVASRWSRVELAEKAVRKVGKDAFEHTKSGDIDWMEAVYHRGLKDLLYGMKARNEDGSELNETIYERVDPENLRKELSQIREGGDKDAISRKEMEIVWRVKEELERIPYSERVAKPAEMLAGQTLNCVGYSEVAAAMFKEIGIKFVTLSIPDHSAMMIATAVGELNWIDIGFTREMSFELKDDDIASPGVSIGGLARDIYDGKADLGRIKLRNNRFTGYTNFVENVFTADYLSAEKMTMMQVLAWVSKDDGSLSYETARKMKIIAPGAYLTRLNWVGFIGVENRLRFVEELRSDYPDRTLVNEMLIKYYKKVPKDQWDQQMMAKMLEVASYMLKIEPSSDLYNFLAEIRDRTQDKSGFENAVSKARVEILNKAIREGSKIAFDGYLDASKLLGIRMEKVTDDFVRAYEGRPKDDFYFVSKRACFSKERLEISNLQSIEETEKESARLLVRVTDFYCECANSTGQEVESVKTLLLSTMNGLAIEIEPKVWQMTVVEMLGRLEHKERLKIKVELMEVGDMFSEMNMPMAEALLEYYIASGRDRSDIKQLGLSLIGLARRGKYISEREVEKFVGRISARVASIK